jgi:pentose-5-phosphate-3-epimerase
MINFIKAKKGFDAAIEVDGSIFQLRNVNSADGSFTHIDISDEDGKFLDEFCSGFGIDLDDEPEEVELTAKKVFQYIDENLMF